MVHVERIGEVSQFEYPTEERWGLNPEEQVLLFGDPGQHDKYGEIGAYTLICKYQAALTYLAYFWPKDAIPAVYAACHSKKVAMMKRAAIEDAEGVQRYPGLYEVRPVIEEALFHDLDDGNGWFQHETAYRDAGVSAVTYARTAAERDGDPLSANERLEYILKLIDEHNAHGRRGDMRSGGGAWVELPPAPWHNSLEQFPMRLVDDELLF